jgi:VanZ family protein
MRAWAVWAVTTVLIAFWLKPSLPLVFIPTCFALASAGIATRWPALGGHPRAPEFLGFLTMGTTMFWAVSNNALSALALILVIVYCAFRLYQYSEMRFPWVLFVAALLAWGVGYLSGPRGGAGWMVAFLEAQYRLTETRAMELVHEFRKTFHFCFYGLNAALWNQGLRKLDSTGNPILRMVLSLGVVGALAAMDEARQHFVPNRTGSAWDVMLDLSGAATFLLVLAIWERRTLNAKS